MRPILLFLALLMSISYGLNAQNNSKKIQIHKVWVKTVDGSKTKGVLYSADEQSIKISKNNSFSNSNLIVIDREKIDVIKIRRKGKIGKSVWIGAASGAGFGAVIGMAANNDEWKGVAATAFGLLFGLIGTGVGAVVGSSKQKIQINGNSEVYISNLSFLQSTSFVTSLVP
jgi:small nuclear ribonucleoprotein (snRNP)-like protein